MKKFALLFPFLFVLLVLTGTIASAQTATDPASKTTEIMTVINSKVTLSATQQTDVQKAVSELAGKFQGANTKASGSGLQAKVGADEQKALQSKANTDIPKLLNSTQQTQYSAVQSKVSTLFSQIK